MATDEITITRKNQRGMGSIFQRGDTFWICYYRDGRRYRESSGSSKEIAAAKLLKKRLAEAASGKPIGPEVERTTLRDLLGMLENDYAINQKSTCSIKAPMAHLLDHFGPDCKARNITSDAITAYVAIRQRAGAANATINRSLAALRRAFRLAEIAGKVAVRPHIAMLDENNARQGFLTHDEFIRLCDALPDDLRDPVAFLYYSGWRVGEMRSLQWRDVDLSGGVIRLRIENSKNKRGRVLPLRGEIREIIERAHGRRIPECLGVFRREDGRPVALFRKSWASACRNAGLGTILVHDLRRCSVRNMIRAGVPEKVAMSISGHRTRSVFDRYNIVTEDDLAAAMDRVGDHLAAQPQAQPSNVITLRRAQS
ncbi:MAG TPA: site-specific integrase [Candidatus Binataceae bacterium]|nr:site-specific integrase [Candidatus Binataceae bacterium]